MIKISVESIEVYAKLNYLRDKCLFLLGDTWEDVKEEYLKEAREDLDMVLTDDEIDSILECYMKLD